MICNTYSEAESELTRLGSYFTDKDGRLMREVNIFAIDGARKILHAFQALGLPAPNIGVSLFGNPELELPLPNGMRFHIQTIDKERCIVDVTHSNGGQPT